MPIFIWISEGPTGENAKPLLASTDPQVIEQFLRVLERRICGNDKEPGTADPGE